MKSSFWLSAWWRTLYCWELSGLTFVESRHGSRSFPHLTFCLRLQDLSSEVRDIGISKFLYDWEEISSGGKQFIWHTWLFPDFWTPELIRYQIQERKEGIPPIQGIKAVFREHCKKVSPRKSSSIFLRPSGGFLKLLKQFHFPDIHFLNKSSQNWFLAFVSLHNHRKCLTCLPSWRCWWEHWQKLFLRYSLFKTSEHCLSSY